MKKLSDVEKILDKTLYMIGKTGSFNVPIRRIAKEADVNVGAINYYFRSKDNLMLYVKEFYIDNLTRVYSLIEDFKLDVKEKIVKVASSLIEYTLKYPGVLIISKEAEEKQETSETDAGFVLVRKDGRMD